MTAGPLATICVVSDDHDHSGDQPPQNPPPAQQPPLPPPPPAQQPPNQPLPPSFVLPGGEQPPAPWGPTPGEPPPWATPPASGAYSPTQYPQPPDPFAPAAGATHHAAAPQPPVPPPGGAENWPWWYGLATFGIGLIATLFVVGLLGAVYIGTGGKAEDPGFLIVATILQGLIFAGTAVGVARWSGPVRAIDFGLRRARLGPTIGKAAAILAIYFAVVTVYAELVHLKPDDSADKLGAGDGTLGMLGFVVMAAIIAPIAEEFFFRGMVFRSFVNGIGVVGGALASGLLFGAMHIDSVDQDRLLQIVPLALLGVLFAALYVWSGTLYSAIALHATNNALAVIVYANDHQSTLGIVLAVVAWTAMMAFCLVGWRLTDPLPNPPGSVPGDGQ